MRIIQPINLSNYPEEQTQNEKNEIFRNKINEIIEAVTKLEAEKDE